MLAFRAGHGTIKQNSIPGNLSLQFALTLFIFFDSRFNLVKLTVNSFNLLIYLRLDVCFLCTELRIFIRVLTICLRVLIIFILTFG